jgi:hypothetical protein
LKLRNHPHVPLVEGLFDSEALEMTEAKPVAEAIREALTQLRARDGDEPARRYATDTIEASALFLIHACGLVAARQALLGGVTALDREFAQGNCEYLQ